jgi:phage major head subunit gpT-like protein
MTVRTFFDADHPQTDTSGNPISISNFKDGSGPAWFLLDTPRAIKPMIWQEREDYEFQSLTSSTDSHVFMNDEYVYGVRARVNAGFGLWQLGFGSKATLDTASYANARAAMMDYRSENGRILGINPTTLVVPPALEDAALRILNTENGSGGESNPWKGTAELILTPFVSV